MQTSDFFRSRIDAMINLNDPLAVLATLGPKRSTSAFVFPHPSPPPEAITCRIAPSHLSRSGYCHPPRPMRVTTLLRPARVHGGSGPAIERAASQQETRMTQTIKQAADAVLGRSAIGGTIPVSLPGAFMRGDGMRRDAVH